MKTNRNPRLIRLMRKASKISSWKIFPAQQVVFHIFLLAAAAAFVVFGLIVVNYWHLGGEEEIN